MNIEVINEQDAPFFGAGRPCGVIKKALSELQKGQALKVSANSLKELSLLRLRFKDASRYSKIKITTKIVGKILYVKILDEPLFYKEAHDANP